MAKVFQQAALFALLIAATALTGCAKPPQDWDEWEARYMRPLGEPVPARFWVKEEWLGRIPNVMEHPCAGLIARQVTSIPQFADDSPFSASPVVEIDGEGNVLAEWGVPVQAEPLDIAGDWLLVRPEDGNVAPVWIGPNGAIRRSQNIPDGWGNPPYDGVCRVGRLDFDPWCMSMKDRHDGRTRLVVAETICS